MSTLSCSELYGILEVSPPHVASSSTGGVMRAYQFRSEGGLPKIAIGRGILKNRK
jgi:hypothetical protein